MDRQWGRLAVGLAVLAVVGVVGGYGVAVRGRPQPLAIESASPTPSSDATPRLFVHVAGAVRSPGLYRLPEGARVDDAIGAAGGPLEDADLDALNLAQALQDGDKVLVPAVGGSTAPAAAGEQASSLVNLNTATAGELESLPGIGPALAERIVAFREEVGGFRTIDDLLDVSGIGEKTLDGFRDLVTV